MIFQRYLFKEVLQVFAAVLAVLLLVYVSHRLVRYLAQAASGYISADLIVALMVLKLVENLAILIPLALYLGVLLALSRLYRDSEVIALGAGGIGVRQLARSLVWFACGFGLLAGVLSTYVSPLAAQLQHSLYERAKAEARIVGIQAGRFSEFGDGERVVYAERIGPDGRGMENVFAFVRHRRGQDLLVADGAYPSAEGHDGERFVVLENGYRYSGAPGTLDFVITRFVRHAIRLEQAANPGYRTLEATPTLELVREGGLKNLAELQWRISMPVSAVLLALLAVPMARSSPREGRYARLMTAFVLYFLYNNAMSIARKLIERGDLHPGVGMWPVHMALAGLALGLLLYQTSMHWRIPGLVRGRRGPPS